MKYVLSTGKVTNSKVMYIKDCIKLEMSLLRKDIPYFSGGIDIIDDTIITSNVQASISSVIESMLRRISSNIDGVELSLESVGYNDNLISIEIKVNGVSSYYEIERTN